MSAGKRDAVAKLAAACPQLPRAYLDFLRISNGAEGPRGVDPGWFVAWAPEDVLEPSEGYAIPEHLPGYFAFDSNGGAWHFVAEHRLVRSAWDGESLSFVRRRVRMSWWPKLAAISLASLRLRSRARRMGLVSQQHPCGTRNAWGQCRHVLLHAAASLCLQACGEGPMYLWVLQSNERAQRFYARVWRG